MNQLSGNFGNVLGCFLQRAEISVARLARQSGVSKRTLEKWLESPERKPQRWQQIVQVATILGLKESEVDKLLTARNETISLLKRRVTSAEEIALLRHWRGPFLAPPKPSVIVGRKLQIDQIITTLTRTDKPRICVIFGMVGTGKTWLASYLAHELQGRFTDGVLWADFKESAEIEPKLARFLEVHDAPPSSAPLDERVRTMLQGRQTLIILDNVPSGKVIEMVRPNTPECAILVTTQKNDLRLPLDTERIELMPFNQFDDSSIQLFIRYLGDERVQREIDVFYQIADAVGHLPLALTIIANRLQTDPTWRAIEFLTEDLLPERKKLAWEAFNHDDLDIRASFNVSYKHLSETKQQLFAKLGVFQGTSFESEAVAHVLQLLPMKAKQLLREFYSLALVQKLDTDRYQLHPLLNRFAIDFLSGRESFIRKISYYVDFAQAHSYQHPVLQAETENLLQMIDDALEQGLYTALVNGLNSTHNFWLAEGRMVWLADRLNYALELVRTRQDQTNEARLLAALSATTLFQGDSAGATNSAETAYQLATLHNDQLTLLNVLKIQGGIYRISAPSIAHKKWEEAFAIAERLGNQYEQAKLSYNLANSYERLVMRDSAESYLQKGVIAARSVNDMRTFSALLGLQGTMSIDQGRFSQAATELQQSIEIAQNHRLKKQVVTGYIRFGYLRRLQGLYRESAELYDDGLTLARKAQFNPEIAYLLSGKAEVMTAQYHYDIAYPLLDEALQIAEKIGDEHTKVVALTDYSVLIRDHTHDFSQAEKRFVEAITIAERINASRDIMQINLKWGEMLIRSNDLISAEFRFKQALRFAEEGGFSAEKQLALYGLERLAHKNGNTNAINQIKQCYAILGKIGHYEAPSIRSWLNYNERNN